MIEYLTAETETGRRALEEVMRHSYTADIGSVPAAWARVRLADGVPVTFILVDPGRQMDFPGGSLRYAFILDVATREDRRGEGHFRGIMEDTFAGLRAAGVPVVVTHGQYQLYRRFDFDVFTHHCGIFATPEQIERKFGGQVATEVRDFLVIAEHRAFQEDLLVVIDISARTLPEYSAALQAAAAVARERGKSRILFEHPPAPSYGSRYPIHPSPETPFTALARACGAQVCIQGADPEGGAVPDADWIKVLDAAAFVRDVLLCLRKSERALPKGTICLDTDAGLLTLSSTGDRVTASAGARPGVPIAGWPSAALAQLVTGYQAVEVLSAIHDAPLAVEALALLRALFPPCWRFSRNESWTFRA